MIDGHAKARLGAYLVGLLIGACASYVLFSRSRYETGYEDAYHWCEQKVRQLALGDQPPRRWGFESSTWERRLDPPGPVCGTHSLWAIEPYGRMRDLWDEPSERR